jgi:hypothetical protein
VTNSHPCQFTDEEIAGIERDHAEARERQRLRDQLFARLDLIGKESRAAFVAAALWGAAENARLIDSELEREIHRVLLQAIAVRNKLRDRIRAIPRSRPRPQDETASVSHGRRP